MKALLVILALLSTLTASAQYNTDRLMLNGRSALYYEDYVLSIQYFNQVLNLKPYLYEPWYFRAIAKYNLDDFTGARQDVSRALELNPYVGEMWELSGLSNIRLGQYDKAIADYDRSLRDNPSNQNAWYNRALCRVEQKDYGRAQLDLDTIVAKWKNFAAAYSLKAEVCLLQSDTTEAEKWLARSIEVDAFDGNTWAARAMIALSRERWADADEYLSKTIHLKPKNVPAYINRALARLNQNNLRGAMDDYDRAIDLDGRNFLAHYNRGLLRMQLGDDNRAIDDFDYVLSIEPDNVMATLNRGILLQQTGNYRAAVKDYTRVLEVFPDFWGGLQRRAECYYHLGMTAKAEADRFAILKAQMEKRAGRQTRWSDKKRKEMRRRSEIDPDKYSSIVVDDTNSVEHEYKNDYRGRVQNLGVQLALQPPYRLSLVKAPQTTTSYAPYDDEVEAYNAAVSPPYYIYITCTQPAMTQDMASAFGDYIATLSEEIDNAPSLASAKNALLSRAVAYGVMQDFQSAINDLTVYEQTDTVSALMYWQRAVCQAMVNDLADAKSVDASLLAAKALHDINRAIALSPQNAYLYYVRGCLQAKAMRTKEAIDDFTLAISIDPRMAEAYYNRGLLRHKSSDDQAAKADLSKAGEMGLYSAYSVMRQITQKK